MAARSLRCPSCGAAVPLRRRPRCLFCLAWVDVPPDVQIPLDQADRLERTLETADAELRAARSSARSVRWARLRSVVQIGCGALAVVGMLGVQVAVGGVDPGSVLAIGANLLVYAGIGGAMLAGWLVSLGMASRRLRRLPLADVRVEDRLVPDCPACARALPVDGGLTAICGGCGVESLLPAALVDGALRAKHARVLAARGDLGDFHAGQQSSYAVTQGLVGCAYLGVAALIAVVGLVVLGLAAVGWGPAIAGAWSIVPAGLSCAMFGWTGLGQVLAARRTDPRPGT